MITPPSVTTKSKTKRNSIPQAGIRRTDVVLCAHISVHKHSHRYVYKKRFLKDHVCWCLVSPKHFFGYECLQDFLIILVWPPTHCLHPWVASNNHSSVFPLFYVEQFVTSIPIRNSWLPLQIKMAYKMALRFLPAGFIILGYSWVQKYLDT